jgi:ABC-type nitrate/sulfonate/bicarbonate transport system substrate-binding protein
VVLNNPPSPDLREAHGRCSQEKLGIELEVVLGTSNRIVKKIAEEYPTISPYILIAGPSVSTIEALKGTTVGSSRPAAAVDFITRLMLTKLGLDPNKQVNIRYTGP